MAASPEALNLRAFLAQVERGNPKDILRFKERIALDYDATAIALELERGRAWQAPVLWFENVADSDFPVVTNVFATRGRYAMALGTSEERLIEDWALRGDRSLEPVLHDKGPVQDVIYKGADVDLARIPIKKHFERDGGRYITNGIIIAKDPETGVRNASHHRMMVKGKTRLGTSLHSRRHLWDYVRRAEELKKEIPIAIVIGGHPLVTQTVDVHAGIRLPADSPDGRWTSPSASPFPLKSPPRARSSLKAISCPAYASLKARSRSSPATTRNARPRTSSRLRRSPTARAPSTRMWSAECPTSTAACSLSHRKPGCCAPCGDRFPT